MVREENRRNKTITDIQDIIEDICNDTETDLEYVINNLEYAADKFKKDHSEDIVEEADDLLNYVYGAVEDLKELKDKFY